MTNPKWDRHAINAEVRRRGLTLTGIALDANLHAGACRAGIIGMSRPGAEAIAKALDVPFRELFPDSYTRNRHNEAKTTSNGSGDNRAKAAAELDGAAPGT